MTTDTDLQRSLKKAPDFGPDVPIRLTDGPARIVTHKMIDMGQDGGARHWEGTILVPATIDALEAEIGLRAEVTTDGRTIDLDPSFDSETLNAILPYFKNSMDALEITSTLAIEIVGHRIAEIRALILEEVNSTMT